MNPFRFKLLAVAIASTASIASANDASIRLDDLVVSASGFEQKITDAPASISVVTREELERKRFSNLAEALSDVEGIDVGQGTGKTGGINISMRGMPSEYTLVMIDGRRQNTSGNVTPNGFGETSTSFLPPVSAIERIEVIRGPMSTLYGSDAMGGVINIITRKVAQEWSGSISADTTYQENRDAGDSHRMNLYASGPLIEDRLGLAVRGSWFERKDANLTFNDGTVISQRGPSPVGAENTTAGIRLTLTPNDQHDISLDFDQARQTYNNDKCQLGSLDGLDRTCTLPALNTANGYEKELKFNRDRLTLSHTGRFAVGTLESSLMVNETETLGRTIPGTIGQAYKNLPSVVGGNPRDLINKDVVLDTKFFTPVGDQHMITVGGQYIDASLQDGIADQKFEQKSWALFAEDEWFLRDDLALTIGGRYDHHDQFGGHLSPRGYLVWSVSDQWTAKGGMSRGYKTPSLNDLHAGINGATRQGEVLTIGNPNLKPETVTSTELGLYFDNQSSVNANATIFHNNFSNKIANGDPITISGNPRIPDGTYSQSVNIDEAVTQGLELAARLPIVDNWSLSLNYTYTDTEQKSGDNSGRPLTLTPKHMANATLDWRVNSDLNLWFKGEYRGKRERFTSSYENLANADGSYSTSQSIYDTLGARLSDYTVFHLGGSYKASSNLTFSASIYNLFDKDFIGDAVRYNTYNDSGGVNGDGFGNSYFHSLAATTGTIEEGRRLWLSAVYNF